MNRLIASRLRARRGFTLIELLAVILIISILAYFLLPQIPAALNRAKVTACKKNLSSIYEALLIYNDKFKDVPTESGARFVASPITSKIWENTKQNADRLTCPNVLISSLSSIAGRKANEWFADPDTIDGQSTSYAGRDMANKPLRKFPGSGKEPLIADDNDGDMNHDTETNVLYADGSVQTLELKTLEDEGLLAKGEKLLVGADSQVEELTKLSLQ